MVRESVHQFRESVKSRKLLVNTVFTKQFELALAFLEAVAGGEQWRGLQGQQGDQKWQVVWPCRPLAGLALFGSL